METQANFNMKRILLYHSYHWNKQWFLRSKTQHFANYFFFFEKMLPCPFSVLWFCCVHDVLKRVLHSASTRKKTVSRWTGTRARRKKTFCSFLLFPHCPLRSRRFQPQSARKWPGLLIFWQPLTKDFSSHSFQRTWHLLRSAWKSWGLYRVCLRRWTKPYYVTKHSDVIILMMFNNNYWWWFWDRFIKKEN